MLNSFTYPPEQKDNVHNFYKEIFEENEYHRYGSKIEKGDVVFDLGSHLGLFTHFAHSKGASQIYSVENNTTNYKYLVDNTSHFNNVHTFKGTFSNRCEGENEYNLEKLMTIAQCNEVDFVKMDIEGSEYPTLFNTDKKILAKVRKWAIEFHLNWDFNSKLWNTGHDFEGHYTSKLIRLMSMFSKLGYSTNLEHIHTQFNIVMFYAYKL